MALKETQQILEAWKRSTSPLICVGSGAGADGYASALGMARVLEKLDKKPTIVAADGNPPGSLQFLPGHANIKPAFENLRRFIIELDASKTKVSELHYEMKGEKLVISLTPKTGFWNQDDVRISSTGYRHDLVICIGAPDLESCAHLYREHPDFFYRTPILNIDHSPANEQYGQLNIVDLTASACGEVCHDLVESIEPGLMDEETATCFLTGMISKTRSFKAPRVTPKTLSTASKLMAKGAQRETIVHHLYRTRSVSTLRLWGRALARLKQDPSVPLVWTLLSQQDFMHAGAEEEDLADVVDELIASSPEAQVVVLLYEGRDRNIHAVVRAERPRDALALCATLRPQGNKEEVRLRFEEHSIGQAEQKLLPLLSEELKRQPV